MARRRQGSELLEFLLALSLALVYLSGLLVTGVARTHLETRRRQRRLAYFLVRGLAAELPLSLRARTRGAAPLAKLVGIQRDRTRLSFARYQERWLQTFHLEVILRRQKVFLELTGPGVREVREIPRERWWGRRRRALEVSS